jgi:hypothetical protein
MFTFKSHKQEDIQMTLALRIVSLALPKGAVLAPLGGPWNMQGKAFFEMRIPTSNVNLCQWLERGQSGDKGERDGDS